MANKTIDLKQLLESKLGGVEPLQGSITAIENAGRQYQITYFMRLIQANLFLKL